MYRILYIISLALNLTNINLKRIDFDKLGSSTIRYIHVNCLFYKIWLVHSLALSKGKWSQAIVVEYSKLFYLLQT